MQSTIRLSVFSSIFIALITLVSCAEKHKNQDAIDKIPVDIKVTRFEKAFFGAKPEELPKLKKEFPLFFPAENNDSIWTEKMVDPQWRELYREVEKVYGDFTVEKEKIDELYRHIMFYFPNAKIPHIYTIVGEMDYSNKVVDADSLVIISLDMYLGKDHRFYEFPKYLKQNFRQNQILPDIATAFVRARLSPPQPDFMSQMIVVGKELYVKDLLLPDYSDADKIGYTEEQIKWSHENEAYIWRNFVENQYLYSSDQKLISRFINPAPFSKFYLEIDNDSPGRIGTYMGWQIVRSFMDNNNISLTDMLAMDAKQLFEKSRYKPKKDE